MIRLHLWLIKKTIWYFLKKRNPAQTIVTLIFLSILADLAVISFFSGKFFAAYLVSFESFSSVFLRFTLLSLVSALSVLSLLSFVLAYLKTLFEKNLSLLIIGAASVPGVGVAVFISTLGLGSWPFLLVSWPFFLGMTFGMPKTGIEVYLVISLIHLILSVVIAGLAGAVALMIQRYLRRNMKRFFPVMVLVGLIGLFYFFTNIIYPSKLGLISAAKTVSEVENSLSQLPLSWRYLPSTLFVDAFLGNRISLIWLLIEGLSATFFFIYLLKAFYHQAWQSNYEGYLMAEGASRGNNRVLLFPKRFFSKNTILAFTQKEFLSLVRSTNAYLYFSFIVFLAAILVFFLSQAGNLTSQYQRLLPLVEVASYFSISYIMLLFTLRFVFPSVVLEKPFMWLVISTSRIRTRMLTAKWLFYQMLLTIFVIVLAAVTGNYLRVFFFATLGIFMGTFALTIGQVFQRDLPKKDVEAIATTSPGILLTIISLILGGVSAVILLRVESLAIYLSLLIFALCFMMISFYTAREVYLKSDL